MLKDLWHYARLDLARQILGMFESNLSSALVFFAPRRMGKTEFLSKDIRPLAEKHGWQVFYFSFFDVESDPSTELTQALLKFRQEKNFSAQGQKILGKIKKVSGKTIGISASIELNTPQKVHKTMREIMEQLNKGRTLLLLDEIQMLAEDKKNVNFIAAFRTTLDLYKDNIKVIFTGSSQEGLRKMFSQAKAPFFHFGQNLPFPELGSGFTDHLSNVFHTVTQKELNKKQLWQAFIELKKIPQLARNLVEKLALHPSLTIHEAKKQLLEEVFDARAFVTIWKQSSMLEHLLLIDIASGRANFFNQASKTKFRKILGIDELPNSAIQSALRGLQRKQLIGHHAERSSYYIDDPNFESWLKTAEI